MDNVIITQSLTKALGFYVIEDSIEMVDICPSQVYKVEFTKEYERQSTEPMLYGDYLETGILGSGREGKQTIDLPRKKLTKGQEAENIIRQNDGKPLIIGEKRVYQERLDKQIERFSLVCAQRQINIIPGINTQMPLITHWRDKYFISGVLDVFPTTILFKGSDEEKMALAVIDIKATSDVNSEYFNKDEIVTSLSCYGKPEYLAKNQSLFYNYLVRNINFDVIKTMFPDDYNKITQVVTQQVVNVIHNQGILFYLIACGYGKDITLLDPQIKFLQMKWSDDRMKMFENLVEQTIQAIMAYDISGWQPNPNIRHCKHCPVKDCSKKITEIVI